MFGWRFRFDNGGRIMSNNTPDYTDNLAFDPAVLNPCNEGKRSSDVLTATLEKCQAIVAKNVELEKKLSITSKNLAFAKLSLRYIIDCCKDSNINNSEFCIKRICKKAEKTLENIRGEQNSD